jgi:hypothetical protein
VYIHILHETLAGVELRPVKAACAALETDVGTPHAAATIIETAPARVAKPKTKSIFFIFYPP